MYNTHILNSALIINYNENPIVYIFFINEYF